MKKNLILTLILLLIMSCEDDPIEAGIDTLVYGAIYDSINDIPIENVKIRLAEYRTQGTFAGRNYNFKGFIDSTMTDFKGEYNFPFKTTGNGNKYEIQLEYEDRVHISDLKEFIQDENIGKEEELNFDALKLFPVDLRVETTDEINKKIYIFNQFPSRNIPLIEPLTKNSVRRLWIDKNVVNQINFQIQSTSPYLNYFIDIPINNTTELYEHKVEISSTDFQ